MPRKSAKESGMCMNPCSEGSELAWAPEGEYPRKYPRVIIVVLSWNQKCDTLECLKSLSKLDYPNRRVIVVDQDSADGTHGAIKTYFPEVLVIRNAENVGFAEGNNIGIRHALTDGPEYIVLLNNDTTVEHDFLRVLIDAARNNPDFDVFGPKIVFESDPAIIWSAGSYVDWRQGICIQRGLREVDRGQYDNYEEVNALTACAMMISRKALDTVGLLDSRYFIYYEETDWCARATSAGFRLLYVPATVVRHKVSAAMGVASPGTVFYFVRNNLLFITKNTRGLLRLRLLGKSLFGTARATCSALVKGNRKDALARVGGVAAFFCGSYGKANI